MSKISDFWNNVIVPAGQVATQKTNGSYLMNNPTAAQNATGFAKVLDSASVNVLNRAGFPVDRLDFNVPPTSAKGSRRSSSPGFEYIDAALAQQYGMSRETAYQEALANTSHQREVQDLISAGLNPVLSANGGSGASVFSGSSDSGGSSYGTSGAENSAKSVGEFIANAGAIIGAVIGIESPGTGKAVTAVSKGVGKLLS